MTKHIYNHCAICLWNYPRSDLVLVHTCAYRNAFVYVRVYVKLKKKLVNMNSCLIIKTTIHNVRAHTHTHTHTDEPESLMWGICFLMFLFEQKIEYIRVYYIWTLTLHDISNELLKKNRDLYIYNVKIILYALLRVLPRNLLKRWHQLPNKLGCSKYIHLFDTFVFERFLQNHMCQAHALLWLCVRVQCAMLFVVFC